MIEINLRYYLIYYCKLVLLLLLLSEWEGKVGRVINQVQTKERKTNVCWVGGGGAGGYTF